METKTRFNKAIMLLTEFIIHRTKFIEFVTKETTTNNYEEFVKIGKPFEISLEGISTSIYGNEYINMLGRVWHDDVHLIYGLDFGFEDEKKVSAMQELELLGWSVDNSKDRTTTMDAMQLIHEDIVGQYEYYLKNKKFVPDQYKYVYARFKKKIEHE